MSNYLQYHRNEMLFQVSVQEVQRQCVLSDGCRLCSSRVRSRLVPLECYAWRRQRNWMRAFSGPRGATPLKRSVATSRFFALYAKDWSCCKVRMMSLSGGGPRLSALLTPRTHLQRGFRRAVSPRDSARPLWRSDDGGRSQQIG